MRPSTRNSRGGADEVAVLTYHALAAQAGELERRPAGTRLYVFTLDEFRRHLDHLAAEGFTTILMADFVQWHQGEAKELPERPIVVSFDDGHRSQAELALPELRQRGLKAIFFITAGRVGAGDWVTWDHVRAMRAAGMEVGSHTLTHPSPSTLAPDALRRELAESKRVLESGLGGAVDFVASPTGYDSRHFGRLAREVGYKAALQGVIGRNRRSTGLFALRRLVLKRSYGFELFCRLVDPVRRAYRPLRMRQALRNAARRAIGASAYEAIRSLVLKRRGD
ncbi:MAG TPA: polysaccharide deacetylase family protein [Planctomycetota bacterium]|nr:polysaccharide deacetylase family protein [Planctomycetota bacterium]